MTRSDGNISASWLEMTMCISDAIDLVSPQVVLHHKKVAYIAGAIGEAYGYSSTDIHHLMVAGLLHDSGSLSLTERLDTLSFELDKPHQHAELGYHLLKGSPLLDHVAQTVRFHHVSWEQNHFFSEQKHMEIPLMSHIIHLADRVSILINQQEDALAQKERVTGRILNKKGTMFHPELVEAFREVAEKHFFWLDLKYHELEKVLVNNMRQLGDQTLGLDELLDIAGVVYKLIDFRSRFTSTHSSGVAATAVELSKQIGFSELERQLMRLAGYFHDLGKLAVPAELLNKKGKLTFEEFEVIKKHTYYTYRTLERVEGFETVNLWAALHHERLDGEGYPFHFRRKELMLGSRIMAVADVFTALTEDRPYRQGMPPSKVTKLMNEMAASNQLDPNIVALLLSDYERFAAIREAAQKESRTQFEAFEGGFDGSP